MLFACGGATLAIDAADHHVLAELALIQEKQGKLDVRHDRKMRGTIGVLGGLAVRGRAGRDADGAIRALHGLDNPNPDGNSCGAAENALTPVAGRSDFGKK